MRRAHFERFAPICPACRLSARIVPLAIHVVFEEHDDDIVHGALACTERMCRREYPIVDGIPFLVVDLASFLSHQGPALMERQDLPQEALGMLGDGFGDGLGFNYRRQQLSSYGYGHFGDKIGGQSNVVELLEALTSEIKEPLGAVLDVGCSAGRSTLDFARKTDDLVLGLDLSINFLRMARNCRDGTLSLNLRKIGVVYEHHTTAVSFEGSERVDFWAADATALPFLDGTFNTVLSMNVLDCVPNPYAHVHETCRALGPGGRLLLTSPFDWTTAAVEVAHWLGGHSARGPHGGKPEPALHRLFDPKLVEDGWIGARIERVIDELSWRIYVHERATMDYRVHGLVARKDS